MTTECGDQKPWVLGCKPSLQGESDEDDMTV